MDHNQKFYDLSAQGYAEEWYTNDLMLKSIKEYMDLFTIIKPRILDLGCGPGNESRRLSQCGANVVGIDFSSESIRIAQEKNPDLKFYEMNFFNIDKFIGSFDGIFACSSLIHLKKEKLNDILEITRKVIVKNGYFFNIYRKGEGQSISYPEINGVKLERIVELYTKEIIDSMFSDHGFIFVKDGYLDPSIRNGWNSGIYQLVN
jgi:2-polyprenyl-3-methyl-5-hydroxy-6-metoxy-1,4-benzoquinol methylase